MKTTKKVASLSPATQNGTQKLTYTCKMVYDELLSVFGDQVIIYADNYTGVFMPYDRKDTLRPYQMAKQGFDNLLYAFTGQVSKSYPDNRCYLGLIKRTGTFSNDTWFNNWFYGSFLIYASYDASKKDPTIHLIHGNLSGFGRVLLKQGTNIRIRSFESVFDGFGASTTTRGNLSLGPRGFNPKIVLLSEDLVGTVGEAFFKSGNAIAYASIGITLVRD